MTSRVPTYRLHRQSGQAVVTLPDGTGGRRDVLLGRYGSPHSRLEYARVIAEWEAAGRRFTGAAPDRAAAPSVNELLLAFLAHADRHYRHADDTPTGEPAEYRRSFRPLRELYGTTFAADFGPRAFKAVREKMLATGLARGVINQRCWRIKRVFKWGVGEELVPPAVHQALSAVAGLARGRGQGHETEPVGPVPDAFVDAVLPHVLPPVRAMIDLQRLTGMRPGEVCRMRACDLDTSGPVWLYCPPHHKGTWRGKARIIHLGQRAQQIVREFLVPDLAAYLFSPRRALAERSARLRAGRKTRVQPSQQHRRKRRPRRQPGERYTTTGYSHAIRTACRRAAVPPWHANQLRHSYATAIRKRYGLVGAQVALGHSKADVTQVYAERDLGLAARIAAEVG